MSIFIGFLAVVLAADRGLCVPRFIHRNWVRLTRCENEVGKGRQRSCNRNRRGNMANSYNTNPIVITAVMASGWRSLETTETAA